MNTQKRYAPEFRERAARLVEELQNEDQSQWSAMQSIAQKLVRAPETLRRWVRKQECDHGIRAGLRSDAA